MKRGQTHLFMQKQPYYLLACCRLVTNHLPKNWEMGFLGFVKCQFKQDIFFFILFVKVFPCVFAKSFQGEIIKWAKNLAKNWRKDAFKKNPYFSADLRCTKIQFQLLDRHYCRCCFSEMWARKTLKKITRICFYIFCAH